MHVPVEDATEIARRAPHARELEELLRVGVRVRVRVRDRVLAEMVTSSHSLLLHVTVLVRVRVRVRGRVRVRVRIRVRVRVRVRVTLTLVRRAAPASRELSPKPLPCSMWASTASPCATRSWPERRM